MAIFAFSSGVPLGSLVGSPLYSGTLRATAGGGSMFETRTSTLPGGLALTSGAQYAAL